MHIIDSRRINTMRSRLGDKASKLIKNDKFLPFFRNRQMRFEKEFKKSVEIACTKKNPENYLSTIWKSKNVEKSLRWLRSFIAKARELALEQAEHLRRLSLKKKFESEYNPEGRNKILENYKKANIFRLPN